MSSATEIALSISPEAAARVAELGLQREFEQMLEHARQTIPGLYRLEAAVPPLYDLGGEPGVVIDAFVPDRGLPYNPAQAEYGRWQVRTFPPEVCEHFTLLTNHGPPPGR